jgi:hypothetical protein
MTSRPKLGEDDAYCAGACCIPPATAASHAGGSAVWGPNMIGSLCCARHGRRKRKTPPSLRFLCRKVYLAGSIILIAILREGATATLMQRLTKLIGVDRRTVERWQTSARLNIARSRGLQSAHKLKDIVQRRLAVRHTRSDNVTPLELRSRYPRST